MRIAILDDYAGVALDMADWAVLEADVTVFQRHMAGQDELAESLAPFEVVCLMRERTPMPESLIARLPKLRLIVTTGLRNPAIDVAAAHARGITVCGTQSRKAATAELSMLLLLALARGLFVDATSVRHGGWQTLVGRELRGLTLGLVGLGSIGAQMVPLARAFGMDVIAWSRNLAEPRCAELGVGYRPTLSALMTEADAVSIHLVLSARTRGLVDASTLARMKPAAMLVNTSRGAILDTHGLLEALRAAPGRRAALDVFDAEPLPADHLLLDAPLIDRGQLLLTPHVGYVTEPNLRLFYGQTVDAIAAWMKGSPIRVIES